MDIYQLRYFLEAAREQNFARAAKTLHVSPPAISQSISILERSIDKKLFYRQGRNVVLTAEGRTLMARAQRIFDEIERAKQEMKGETASGSIRLAVREMITHYLLPDVLAQLEQKVPGTRLSLYELEPTVMIQALLKDQVDSGYYYFPIPNERIDCELLGQLKSSIYAAPALLRRLGKPKTLAQTLRLPFVAPRAFNDDTSSPSADGFPDHLLQRDIRYRAELLETHRVLALRGLCAAVLPNGTVASEVKHGRLIALPGPALTRDIYFFNRKGRLLSTSINFINAGLRSILKRDWH